MLQRTARAKARKGAAWVNHAFFFRIICKPAKETRATGNEIIAVSGLNTSKRKSKANMIIGISGTFWQREYFDHFIRSPDALDRAIEYVWSNPDNAGFKDWKWRWRAGMEKIGAVSSSNISETISHV